MRKIKLLSLIILPLTIGLFASCSPGKKREDVYLTINDNNPIYFYEKEAVKEYPENYITGDIDFKANDSIKLFYKGKDVTLQSTITEYDSNNLDTYYKIKNDARAKVEFKAVRENEFNIFVNGRNLPSLEGYYVKINEEKLALKEIPDAWKEFHLHAIGVKVELKKGDKISFYKGDNKITKLLPPYGGTLLVGGSKGDYTMKESVRKREDIPNVALEVLEEGIRPFAADTTPGLSAMSVEISYNGTYIGNYDMRTVDNKPEDHPDDFGAYNMSILAGYELSFYSWGRSLNDVVLEPNTNLVKIRDYTFKVLRDFTPADENTYAIHIYTINAGRFNIACNG